MTSSSRTANYIASVRGLDDETLKARAIARRDAALAHNAGVLGGDNNGGEVTREGEKAANYIKMDPLEFRDNMKSPEFKVREDRENNQE